MEGKLSRIIWISYKLVKVLCKKASQKSKGELGLLRQFDSRTKGSFVFKHLCKYCIVLETQRIYVREECLECQMTSNDVREEFYIIIMTGSCVNKNKPVQTEPVGCYRNSSISKVRQLCK